MDKNTANKPDYTESDTSGELKKYDITNDYNTITRSHYKKSLEKKSKKTFLISAIGLLAVIITLIIFGQTLLVNFSVLLSNANRDNTNTNAAKNKPLLIPAPLLDPIPAATNSAKITLTGSIDSDKILQIRIYVNKELQDVTKHDNSGQFNFSDIQLSEGLNKIEAVAVADGKTGNNSNILNINLIKSKPSLYIDYPTNGSSFKSGDSTITVSGKTDHGNSITINDHIAIMKNDGSFSYVLKMQNGDNTIKVIAKDPAGNKTEEVINVNYAP